MRYFIGFLVSIGLIILVFIMVLRGFTGGDDTNKDQPPLSDYANSSVQVRMTVDGPIVAEQLHHAYRITVDRSEARVETFKGYEYETLATQRYDNNQQSYVNFLRALDFVGFTKGTVSVDNKDERGVCASGSRYIMEIINGSSRIQRYWTTTCRGGTFKGDAAAVKKLFDTQIPPVELRTIKKGLSI